MTDIEVNTIYEGDCIEIMQTWPDACVDLCITDPPFNISKKKGLTWAFSSHITMQEAWDRFSKDEYLEFTFRWLQEVRRVVKPNGNLCVFGSFHNIYQIGFVIQELNLRIINSIVWFKPNAQPNITARTLTESTEQIIWACNNPPEKARNWTFNYWVAKELANGKQMRNVWTFKETPESEEPLNLWEIPYTPRSERKYGRHPSQKPEALLERLIRIVSNEGDLILDCFSGAGTTAVVAERLQRKWVMIEKEPAFNEIAYKRLANLRSQLKLPMDITIARDS